MLGEGTFEAVRLVDGVLFWLDTLLAGDGLHTALHDIGGLHQDVDTDMSDKRALVAHLRCRSTLSSVDVPFVVSLQRIYASHTAEFVLTPRGPWTAVSGCPDELRKPGGVVFRPGLGPLVPFFALPKPASSKRMPYANASVENGQRIALASPNQDLISPDVRTTPARLSG